MPTKNLSRAMIKCLEDIKQRILCGEERITIKATKNKTLLAIVPIKGQKHFNLYVNNKIFGSYLFDGKDWRKS